MLHVAYCDESRQTRNRYMVFGAVIVSAENVKMVEDMFRAWRGRESMTAEMKWTKVSRGKLAQYQSFIELGFRFLGEDRLHFKSIVFDTEEIDYKTHHDNDEDLGFHRLFYTFLLHKFAPYIGDDTHRLIVLMDQRNSSAQSLTTMRDVLNHGIRKRHGWTHEPVRAVEARDSKSSDLFQLADVLMGAVGWHCNRCHLVEGCGEAKKSLADRIGAHVGIPKLDCSTPRSNKRFEIWRFQFGAKEKRPDA